MDEKFIRDINNKVGKNIIARGNEILELPRIPTESFSLDAETGGGIPMGRITSLVGEWSSGKTTVALKTVASFQRLWPEKPVCWIDAEGVWDHKWAKALGVDENSVYLARPEYGEQAYNVALEAIDRGAGLIVIDSIAALSAKEEMEKDMDEVTVAAMARVNTRFLRKLGVSFTKEGDIPPTLLLLNQYRKNISQYGPPVFEPGGEALSFFPSLKIVLKKGELYDGKKVYKTIGVNDEGVEPKAQAIKFYTEKNKTAPPKRRGHFWFYFDTLDSIRRKGTYDRLEEIIRYTEKYNVVQRRGKYYDLVNPDTGEVVTFESEKDNKAMNQIAQYIRDNESVQGWVESVITQRVLADMTDDEREEISEKPLVEFKVRDNGEERKESSEEV